jgi:hypothetical protein
VPCLFAQSLLWLVSFPSFIMGLASMAAVRNWASLTTNRTLLSNLMRVYVFAFFLIFIFTLWLTCATFLTFKKVDDWSVSHYFWSYKFKPLATYYVLNRAAIAGACFSLLSITVLLSNVYTWLNCCDCITGGRHRGADVPLLHLHRHLPHAVPGGRNVLPAAGVLLHRPGGYVCSLVACNSAV